MSVDLAQLHWFKSTYSGDNGGQCIEVASAPERVHVRDSKDPEGPALSFAPEAWTAFVGWAGESGLTGR